MAVWVIVLGLSSLPALAETLAEKSLKDIVERQHDIFAKAEKEGDNLDEAWLRGELEGILKSYDILVQKNPDYALAYGGYGMLLGKVGMKKEAVIMLLKANKLDPTLSEVKNQIAVHLAEDGKPVDALPWVTAAIELDPQKALYHFHLGELLAAGHADFVRTGQFDDAKIDQDMLDAFRRASELAAGDFPIAYRYAKAYYDLSKPRWEESLPIWEKLEQTVSNDTQRQLVRMQRVNVLIKLGRKDEARKLIDTVTAVDLATEKQTLLDELAKAGDK
jgi:tetratricopeptide (TPR) repeat protein